MYGTRREWFFLDWSTNKIKATQRTIDVSCWYFLLVQKRFFLLLRAIEKKTNMTDRISKSKWQRFFNVTDDNGWTVHQHWISILISLDYVIFLMMWMSNVQRLSLILLKPIRNKHLSWSNVSLGFILWRKKCFNICLTSQF